MQPRPILKFLTPALLTQLVNALIGVATAFALITITPEQRDAINNLLAVLGLLLTGAGILLAEGQVTPTASPRLPEGTTVTTTNAAGATTGTTSVTPDA